MDFYAFRIAARTFFADDADDISAAGETGDAMDVRASITQYANWTLTGLFSLVKELSAPGESHRD